MPSFGIKSADSISIDTVLLNVLGYTCFTTSVYLQAFDATVRKQFKKQFDGNLPLLSGVDVVYSLHGLALVLVLLSQVTLGNKLWKFNNKRVSFKLSRITKFFYSAITVFLIYHIVTPTSEFKALEFALYLSYFKIAITFTKYLPQVMYNRKRKSMAGISKLQIFLDLLGGLFASAELLLKNKATLAEMMLSNTTKIGIIVVTIIFDTVFLIQFRLYPENDDHLKNEKLEEGIND
ncbi:unnamed protein product [Ambrosiozyma monospora]|uniref:Unnamed protein product n=1 Tax=Ambrosiozyma monospora TaxID=43982 RepID=A0A9W7DK86_AMBMO|nr:unnamed protein product [Ambrosiozyma monospora]